MFSPTQEVRRADNHVDTESSIDVPMRIEENMIDIIDQIVHHAFVEHDRIQRSLASRMSKQTPIVD